MAINTQRFDFTEVMINNVVPEKKGVYCLYDTYGRIIYYGMSEVSIKNRLLSHLNGKEGKCTQSARFFSYEESSNPSLRERLLLEDHLVAFRTLPQCNEKIG